MAHVVLPWPPRELSPNARVHHQAKARVAKAYRTQAYWLTEAADVVVPAGDSEIVLGVEFFPPDKRRRDLDNMFASAKAALDGLADAAGVNDQRFAFLIARRAPVKGGRVVVTL